MSDAAADHHGRSVASSRTDACSVVWDDAHAPTLGTAPAALFWLALEQNGPWGARAATQSHLDPDLGKNLERMCHEAGGRFILIRRPGTHPDPASTPLDVHHHQQPDGGPHRVYLAGGLASRPWLLEADLADPVQLERLKRLDLPSLGGDDIDTVREVLPDFEPSLAPVLMVCANSKRDVCCAVRGRPVALESATQRPGQVWECSHTGGHRFAPTGVLLPYGQIFGRLSGTSAVAALDAAAEGEVPADLLGAIHDRGRSHLTAPGQAAESVVREQIRELSLLALSTTATPRRDQENVWQCRVSHIDGRHWDILAARVPGGEDLPESCGKESLPHLPWSVARDFGR